MKTPTAYQARKVKEHQSRTEDTTVATRGRIPLAHIINTVCCATNVPLSDLMGKGRHNEVVWARQVIAVLARRLTYLSYPEVARGMGKGNHSTIVTQVKRAAAVMRDREKAVFVDQIEAKLRAELGEG